MSVNAFGVSDAARRCSEQVTLHILAGAAGRWAAIRLSDGGSDGIAYDTQTDAVRHQLHPQQCCYLRIPLFAMPEREAEVYMQMNRDLYAKGVRLGDPDAKHQSELMTPIRVESLPPWLLRQMRR